MLTRIGERDFPRQAGQQPREAAKGGPADKEEGTFAKVHENLPREGTLFFLRLTPAGFLLTVSPQRHKDHKEEIQEGKKRILLFFAFFLCVLCVFVVNLPR